MRRLTLIFLLAALVSSLAVSNGAARLLPPSAEPMQLSYRLWAAQHLKLALQRDPRSPRSLFAIRPGQCGFAFGKAWLLPAAVGGVVSTRCRIPAGKFLVVPIGGIFGVAGGGTSGREQDLRRGLRNALRFFTAPTLTVDGRPLRPGHFVSTPLFVVDLPPNNIFGPPSQDNPPGLAPAVSAGRIAILSPLPRGQHTVTTGATYTGPFAMPNGSPLQLGMNFMLTIR